MRFGSVLTSLLFVASTAMAGEEGTVAAPTERFGIVVDDRYRALEHLETDETQAWIASQGTTTRDRLASLPGRAALRARYDAIDAAQPPILSALQPAAGDRVFYVRKALGETTGRLYVRERRLPERALGDGVIGPATRFSVSPDGRNVLLSQAGVAASTIAVIDVASGSLGPVLVDDAWKGAAPRWRPDGAGFHYVAVGKATDPGDGASTLELKSYHFVDGTIRRSHGWTARTSDIDGATIVSSTDARMLFVSTHRPATEHLRVAFVALSADGDEAGHWTELIDEAAEASAFAVHGSAVYARSMKDATLGRLLRYDATHPDRPPVVVFAGRDDGVLQELATAHDGLYLTIRHGYTFSLVRLAYTGSAAPLGIAMPFEGSLRALATDPAHAGALFVLESWTEPAIYLRADGDRVDSLALQVRTPTIGRDWIADTLTCNARDGTRIPMTVVHRQGMRLDGSHPLLINSYGGYGFVEPAYFYPKSQPWIERDGVFADVMPRGSGATGEAWHRAGMGASKANTWTDFEACAETLIARGYTSPDRLIIQGTAIGGLMVGRAMTDRPDLFAAAIMRWGITDALRFIESPAHRPADELELGRADSAQGVTQLLEDSVDAHIRDDVRYPAVFMTTGLKDTRFPAWMQLKTAARLEAVRVAARRPVLLRVDPDGGAGLPMTLAQRNDELADRVAFMLWTVGDPDFQPKP